MADIVNNGSLVEGLKPVGKLVDGPKKCVLVEQDGNNTYIGITGVGLSTLTNQTIWQMMRITDDGTNTSVLWADGNDLFDNKWDDRLIKTYK